MRASGSVIGRLSGSDAGAVAQELQAAAKGRAIGPDGEQWSWARLIRTLHGAASDYREARDGFRLIGNEVQAQTADQRRDQVIQVINALGELYREWPELGLDAQGRLGVPHAVFIVAGIIGGGAIIAWAVSAAGSASAMREISIRAIEVCEADPGSPGCEHAKDIATGAQEAHAESGVGAAVGGAVGVLILGGIAAFVLSRRK